MEQLMPLGAWAAVIGLIGGLVLGLAARLGDFCTLGALEAAVYGHDQTRIRLWGIVVGTAILGTQIGGLLGFIDLSNTFYHQIAWNPFASIAGGLIFGYGMAMAGNCGFGALVRFGGGDLRSLIVVVTLGISGFVALSGPLAPLRATLFPQHEATGPQGILYDMMMVTGLPALVIILVLGVSALTWALSHAPLRERPDMIVWGAAAGLAIIWCFWGTSLINNLSFGQIGVEGPAFTAPVGRTLIFMMTSTAGGITFSVGSVVGVMAGALIGSIIRGMFQWEACEDPRELGRQVGGAAMMGVGGVIAMGCSIGQGVTAFATLAWSGPVTLAAIGVGAMVGLSHLIGGFQPE